MEYLVTAEFMDRTERVGAPTPNLAYAAGLEFEKNAARNVTILTPKGVVLNVTDFWQAMSTGAPV